MCLTRSGKSSVEGYGMSLTPKSLQEIRRSNKNRFQTLDKVPEQYKTKVVILEVTRRAREQHRRWCGDAPKERCVDIGNPELTFLLKINQIGYNQMVEKRKPNCPLPVIQSMAKEGKVRATISAVAGAYALGFDFDEMVSVVMALTANDFYKSMTTHADNKVWQDVYRPVTKTGEIYLKLIVVNDVLIISFKEL